MEWRPVLGWEACYEVSDSGLVRDIRTGKERKGSANNLGYFTIWLTRGGGVKTNYRVHRLVAIAFVANPDGLREVNHKDLVKANNAASNLEWISRTDNMRHAAQFGAYHAGVNPRCIHKLSVADVIEIRRRYDNKEQSTKGIARDFDVAPSTIERIGKRLKRVMG